MQVRCIRDFGTAVVGDAAEVPDGSAVDPVHWEIPPGAMLPGGGRPPPAGDEIAAQVTSGSGQSTVPPASLVIPAKEGM